MLLYGHCQNHLKFQCLRAIDKDVLDMLAFNMQQSPKGEQHSACFVPREPDDFRFTGPGHQKSFTARHWSNKFATKNVHLFILIHCSTLTDDSRSFLSKIFMMILRWSSKNTSSMRHIWRPTTLFSWNSSCADIISIITLRPLGVSLLTSWLSSACWLPLTTCLPNRTLVTRKVP
jgi:hypothetical protein